MERQDEQEPAGQPQGGPAEPNYQPAIAPDLREVLLLLPPPLGPAGAACAGALGRTAADSS